MRKCFFLFFVINVFLSCVKPAKVQESELETVSFPVFNSDSAYQYIQDQVDFGPRVPNTSAHAKCKSYLVTKLRSFGAEVVEQEMKLVAYDGELLNATNVIGSFNVSEKRRVLFCAHWDTRPWADNDSSLHNHQKPVLGANDGASGVGVLLEIARLIQKQQPEVGVDIVFFDAEDYGSINDSNEQSWCLGSQYWSKKPHVNGYNAMYGVLLDMVGAPNATFYKELISTRYASDVVTKIWSAAQSEGFGNFFIDDTMGAITDDHLFVNQVAGIPTVDIIHYNKNEQKFGDYWHTLHDDMSQIDRNTLMVIGVTLTKVLYNEK